MEHVIESKRCDYSRYFLTKNPFPYVSIPGDSNITYVDQEQARSTLLDVIASVCHTGLSNHAVVVGPYGSGKSHTLKYIAQTINQKKICGDSRALVCYIPQPGSSLLDVHRQTLTELGFEVISSLGKHIDNKQMFDSEVYRVIRLLNQSTEEKLAAWRWLTGERLDISLRNKIGVSKNLDDESALLVLKQILHLLQEDGYRLLCLLIDELETVNELILMKRQKLFNGLRHLIDNAPRNLSLIFGCTPAGWDEILENAYALARRLSRNIVYLERLNPEKIAQVVSRYIQPYRIRTTELRTLILKNNPSSRELAQQLELFPFKPSVLPEMFRLSRGNIGELLKYCNIAVDRGLHKGFDYIDANRFNELTIEFQK